MNALEYMDRARQLIADQNPPDHSPLTTAGRDLREAHSAAAELARAARDYADATGSHSEDRWDVLVAIYGRSPISAARGRLRAALAKFDGGT